MPKLIDADAVSRWIGIASDFEAGSDYAPGLLAAYQAVDGHVQDQPDASEPLRARIKELEEALEKVSDTLDDLHRSYGHPLSCSDAIDAAVSLAAETLKGGPDV